MDESTLTIVSRILAGTTGRAQTGSTASSALLWAPDSTESIAAMKSTNVNRRHLVTTSQRASTESAITLVSARLNTRDGTVRRTWMNFNYRRPCAEFIRQPARTWWAIIDAFASPDGLAVIATWISTNVPTVHGRMGRSSVYKKILTFLCRVLVSASKSSCGIPSHCRHPKVGQATRRRRLEVKVTSCQGWNSICCLK